jgi:hypothetical protein
MGNTPWIRRATQPEAAVHDWTNEVAVVVQQADVQRVIGGLVAAGFEPNDQS